MNNWTTTITALLLLVFVSTTIADDAEDTYQIDRLEDSSFNLKINGISINEGSSLMRESILLNDSTCPIQLNAFATKVVYEDRWFRYKSTMMAEAKAEIHAFKVVTVHYDIFGQHIRNYANTDVKDYAKGAFKSTPEWRASESEITTMLTTVTFVSRVRYADGTQWVYDEGKLHAALSSLKLERVAEEEPGDE